MIIFFSNLTEAVIGFGSTLIALTLGSFVMPLETLILSLVPLNLVSSAFIGWRSRKHIDWKELKTKILPYELLGLPMGLLIFHYANNLVLKKIFGVFIIVFAASAFIRFRKVQNQTPNANPLWLVAGGIMQGLYASGGPMTVVYTSRALKDKSQFRATLTLLWLILTCIMTFSYYFANKLTLESLSNSIKLLPFLLAGAVVGDILHH